MAVANRLKYLSSIIDDLGTPYPENRTINLVCHGHSVPAGYFATPVVDTFNAYPHLLHVALKSRFPFAVINVIVTAIGGEDSGRGAQRFEQEVLPLTPRVVAIDYCLNDRRIGLAAAEESWRFMIESALESEIRLILLTPTADLSGLADPTAEQWVLLQEHAQQIRGLAAEYQVGLVDSLAAFEEYARSPGDLTDLMSSTNHPNRLGHEIVARELLRWFPICPPDQAV